MSGQELPLNRKARNILAHAQREAGRLLHGAVEPAHIFLGLLRQGDCFAANLVRHCEPEQDGLKSEIEAILGPGGLENVALEMPFSESTSDFLHQTDIVRKQLHHDEIRSDHLLLAMTHETAGDLAVLLARHGITTKRVLEAILAEYGVVQQATPMEILLLQGLAKKGGLTSQVIQALLSREEGQGVKEVLMAEGNLAEDDIAGLLAKEFGCQSLDLAEFAPDRQLLGQFPGELARRLKVFPVRFDSDEDNLYVALTDPFDNQKMEEIQALWGVNVIPLLTGEQTLGRLLDEFFPLT